MQKKIISGLLLTLLILTILIFRNVFSGVSAASPEKPAPPQAPGTTLSYNFDQETAGAMPAKFHAARTGQGSEGKWAVTTDDNYRLYYVIKESRRQFAGANFKVTSGEWHELKVECVGNKIICYYDGQKKIEATDDTFKEAGKIGLWTKADSVTYFDDLTAKAK